jgi:hypothetical protein
MKQCFFITIYIFLSSSIVGQVSKSTPNTLMLVSEFVFTKVRSRIGIMNETDITDKAKKDKIFIAFYKNNNDELYLLYSYNNGKNNKECIRLGMKFGINSVLDVLLGCKINNTENFLFSYCRYLWKVENTGNKKGNTETEMTFKKTYFRDKLISTTLELKTFDDYTTTITFEGYMKNPFDFSSFIYLPKWKVVGDYAIYQE